MNEIIPNGTKVLVFFSSFNINAEEDETDFIKGEIVSSYTSTSTEPGFDWSIRIYTIIGEDGNKYIATHNFAINSSFFFRTPDEQIKNILYTIKENYSKINDINEENKLLNQTILNLIELQQENTNDKCANQAKTMQKQLVRKPKKEDQ